MITPAQLQSLSDFAVKITTGISRPELMELTTVFMQQNLPGVQTALLIHNFRDNTFSPLYKHNIPDENISRECINKQQPVFEEVIKRGEMLSSNSEVFAGLFPNLQLPEKNALFYPFTDNARPTGVFCFYTDKPDGFSEVEYQYILFLCKLSFARLRQDILSALKNLEVQDLKLKERALNASTNGIIITDATKADNPVIYANPFYYQMSGYTPEEVLGKTCRFLRGDLAHQPGVQKLIAAVSNHQSCTVRIQNRKKDGTYFWNEISISPVFTEDGELINFIGIQQDITQAFKAEMNFRESNARISELISSLSSGILVEDESRHIVIANADFCNIFNIPVDPQFLVGTDCSNAAEESKRLFKEPEAFVKRIDDILSDRKIVKNEIVYFADGRVFERDYVPIYILDEYRGHLWNYRDITARMETETKLEELKTFYESTLNDLPGQIAVFDKNFRYVYLNPSSIKNDQIRSWIIGKDDFEYCRYRGFSTSIAVQRTKRLNQAKTEKKPIRFEEAMVKNDDEVYYFERVIHPILDENGEVEQFLAYGIDITQRVKSEKEIVRINNQLEAVLNTAGEGIVTIDEEGFIVLVNDEIQRMFGWNRDECVGKDLTIMMPEPYREKHHNGMKRYRATKTSQIIGKSISLEGQKKDGTVFPIQLRIKETLFENKLYFTAAISDMTETYKLIKELESSNKALSDFAYIASHDLREPLRKITAFGSILAKTAAAKLDEDDKENLFYMVDGAKRMQEMVDDLLHYSRITKKSRSHTTFSLDEIVNEIISFDLAELISDTGARVITEDRLGDIYGEKVQIKQVMQNLIANGLKYRKPNLTPVIQLHSETKSSEITVRVTDNGIGIDANYHEQIFEMFKRLHAKEEYSGSGIGLAVCKKIIENYNGRIGVISTPSEGSTFWFSLPLNKEDIPANDN